MGQIDARKVDNDLPPIGCFILADLDGRLSRKIPNIKIKWVL